MRMLRSEVPDRLLCARGSIERDAAAVAVPHGGATGREGRKGLADGDVVVESIADGDTLQCARQEPDSDDGDGQK